MPGLYGLGNANVTTSVTNTTGLYQQSGAVEILNSAEQLLTILDNSGNVNFALDPTTSNTTVYAYWAGGNIGVDNIFATGNLYLSGATEPTVFGRVSTVYGSDNLATDQSIIGVQNLLTFSLPTAGIWQISYTASADVDNPGVNPHPSLVYLTDNGGNIVANTTAIIGGPEAGATPNQDSGSRTVLIETAAAATYNLTVDLPYQGTVYASGTGINWVELNPQWMIDSVTTSNTLVVNDLTVNANATIGSVYSDNYFYANGTPFGGGSNYSNANVASYLPVYGGNILAANVKTSELTLNSTNVELGDLANASAYGIAIGSLASYTSAGAYSIAIGSSSAQNGQGDNSVAIGRNAGSGNGGTQGATSTMVGAFAGQNGASIGTTGLGAYAGQNAGPYAIAVGYQAGATNQGANSIVIGSEIGNNLTANAILIATKTNQISSNTGFYVTPVRNDIANTAEALFYNTTTNEFTYAPSYSNANVASYLTTYTGNLSAGNLVVGNNTIINNDLTVDGTIYGTFSGNITGNLVVPGTNTQVIFNNFGNAGANSNFTFNSATDTMTVNGTANVTDLNAISNVTAAQFIGNGSQLTSLTGANVTGIVANASYATTAGSATTADLAQYVTGNAQANITSVGTLTSLTVSGNVTPGGISTAGNITAAYYFGDGSNLTGIVSSYGNANVSAYLASGTDTANIITSGNVSGSFLLGNGAAISGLAPTVRTNISVTSNSGVYSDSNVQYNSTTGVITYNEPSYVANAVNLRFPVKNTSGATLTKGTPIYATGTVGASDTLEVSASRADTAGTMPAIGLLESTLNNNDTGFAVQLGELSGYDTSTYSVGQTLYVGSTGGIVGTRPNDGNAVEPIGTVGRVNASTGIIVVNIWNYFQVPNLGSGNIWLGNINSVATETPFSTEANSAIAAYLPTYTGNISAGNVNATNLYGTIQTAAQPNITSVGTLSSLTVTGNVTPGGISTAGNITASYFLGNGAFLTGITAGSNYGDSNVTTLLASLGSNVISSTANITTTANVSGSYILGNGSALTGVLTSSSIAGVAGDAQMNNGSSGFSNASAFGQPLRIGTSANTVMISGNVITAGQINFAGNSSVGSIIQPTNAWVANTFPSPSRIWIGDNGPADYGATLDILNNNRGAGVVIAAGIPKYDNGVRESGLTASKFFNLPANVGTANSNSRVGSIVGDLFLVGPGSMVNTAPFAARACGYTFTVGLTNGPSLYGFANTNLTSGTGTINSFSVGAGSTVGNAYSYLGVPNNQANTGSYYGIINNSIGYAVTVTSNTGAYTGNVITVYNPGTTNTMGITNANTYRRAPGYFFLKNEDNVAQNQMGSMWQYHEYRANTAATTGTVDINKSLGQVQYLVPTGNVTIGSFQNFVTSASDSVNTDWQADTVTLVIAQGATPYTVTMPTGNTAIKYAGGTSTVANTANAVTIITTTAMNIAGTATYLVSISSEFS